VVNYGICVLTGSFAMGEFPITLQTLAQPIFSWAMVMGFLFISVFNVIAISSVKVGVTITQTANKLSLVIPVAFSFFMYNEEITWVKMLGILLALLAVVFVSRKGTKKESQVEQRKFSWHVFLPIILFIGSGIIDTLTKFVQVNYLKDAASSNTYLIAGFLVAFLMGFVVLMFRTQWQMKSLIAGIVLGVPNYFSIYFLIKALQSPLLSSSAMIPINNIGILFTVGLVGIFLFKEKLSRSNYIGLMLTIISIILIYVGDKK
jgi:drug/metabolite transporter (DMT)-like permease